MQTRMSSGRESFLTSSSIVDGRQGRVRARLFGIGEPSGAECRSGLLSGVIAFMPLTMAEASV